MNKNLAIIPDLLFLVDISLEDMKARLHADRRPACRIERLGDAYHEHVWGLYRDAACAPYSEARKHCAALSRGVVRLDNTRPDQRTVRDVAVDAIRAIEEHISRESAKP